MADPVNSSDEAHRLLAELRTDSPVSAVEQVEAAFARVRAEAVADERRRITDAIARDIHGATLANPELTADFGYNRGLEKAADIARRSGSFDVRASDLLGAWSDIVAAGSVPVATPPAEPACKGFTIRERPDHQPLGPCLHCGKTYQQHRAPSQPVTCEHGEPGRHALTRTNHPLPGCFTTTWCPGPVSVPKESSE